MPNEIKKIIDKLGGHQNITREESARLFQIIMNGGATPAQIAATLLGLKTKGETVEEISGAVDALRHKMTKLTIPEDLRKKAIDVCGTGGDSKGTYNISSAVVFVAAGCGIPVAKHGNKAVSSRSGSADVLAHLGVKTDITPEQAAQTLEKAGSVFLLAPIYHKSFVHVAPVRTELGTRTIFNILGPLLNPAMVQRQVIGVYSKELVLPICQVLQSIGATNAMVVHGADGMDEISICDKTYVAELSNNKIHEYEITPESLGLEPAKIEKLIGGDANQNARALRDVLSGAQNEYRNAVLANTAAALKVAGLATNLEEGMLMASESIDYKKASQALNKLVEVSNSFS
jgi:anthranilate phosphoribosyltransferase